MESPDGSLFCDFCKEPFAKKAKPKEKNPLEGLTKEQLAEIPPEQLLKSEEPTPAAPPWLRTAAWAFFAAWLIGGALILALTYERYSQRAQELPNTPPSPSAPSPDIR